MLALTPPSNPGLPYKKHLGKWENLHAKDGLQQQKLQKAPHASPGSGGHLVGSKFVSEHRCQQDLAHRVPRATALKVSNPLIPEPTPPSPQFKLDPLRVLISRASMAAREV